MGKTNKVLLISTGALLTLTLSSCNLYSIFSSGSSKNSKTSSVTSSSVTPITADGVYQSADFNKTTLHDVSYNRGMDLPPSTGDVDVLVLPIEFTNFTFSSRTLSNIEDALNGTDNSYWESVASFYEKSSFGKLHLNFHVASVYECGLTAEAAFRNNYLYSDSSSFYYDSTKTNGQELVNAAVDNYSDSSYPLTDFDKDEDGIIDAVVAIYSCPDYSQRDYTFEYKNDTIQDNGFFWAYTYWCSNGGDTSSPKANTYVWLSYDFFEYGGKADPHTLIHEYGHAMGLDDYYGSEKKGFQPAGAIDMMDNNITDHDAYTKCVLGWVSPYIVSGDDVTLTIRPSESSGDCVLIPTSSFNGTVYDEYILLELYTPTGLNELDSSRRYRGSYPLGYTVPGIKIYHIDSRLVECFYDKNGYNTRTPYLDDPNTIDITKNTSSYTMIAATNCNKAFNSKYILSSNLSYSSDFSLIHLIEATGINTFSSGNAGTNKTLFKKGSSFSLKSYGSKFFPNKTKMNNGDAFPYTITITDLSGESATIHISKDQ